MILTVLTQIDSANVSSQNAILTALEWAQAALFGSIATILATIAIAAVGFLMLTGRLEIRRGIIVVFGCFILFGARSIVEGLRNAAAEESGFASNNGPPPPPVYPAMPTNPKGNPSTNAYDPYAGASVMRGN